MAPQPSAKHRERVRSKARSKHQMEQTAHGCWLLSGETLKTKRCGVWRIPLRSPLLFWTL